MKRLVAGCLTIILACLTGCTTGQQAVESRVDNAKISALGPLAEEFYAGEWLELSVPVVGEWLSLLRHQSEWTGKLKSGQGVEVIRFDPISADEEAVAAWLDETQNPEYLEFGDLDLVRSESLTEALGSPAYEASYTFGGWEAKFHGTFLFTDDATFYAHTTNDSDDRSWLVGAKVVPAKEWLAASEHLSHLAAGEWLKLNEPGLDQYLVHADNDVDVDLSWEYEDMFVSLRSREPIGAGHEAAEEFANDYFAGSEYLDVVSVDRDRTLSRWLGVSVYVAQARILNRTGGHTTMAVIPTDEATYVVRAQQYGPWEEDAKLIKKLLRSLQIVEA